MKDELPPLPDPEEKTESWRDEWGYENWNYAFSAEQMYDYALQVVKARAPQSIWDDALRFRKLCDNKAAIDALVTAWHNGYSIRDMVDKA